MKDSLSSTLDLTDEISPLIVPQITINSEYIINLSSVQEKLQNTYRDKSFLFEWDLK
jgi:hypothetical protein